MHDVGDHVNGEELRVVHSSSGTTSTIKSRNIGGVRHVETLRKESCIQNIDPETCGEDTKVFHSVRSCTSNTATVFQTKKNSVALVRERTIPTERPPPVGEVSANVCG